MDVQNRRKTICIPLAEVEKYYHFSRRCQWLQNEIMQKESSPLFAADVITELKRQFAFLSGGRAQDGSPIIIFPEYPSFCEIGDQEFRNVLTYLTSIPSLSAAGVGFIVVIDRRQDRWTCLKGTLLRISGWFPANLRLVLVLRPSAILQRTLSDVFFKLHRDDFKVPVIMLSSVADLHTYIERNQLTQELGGSQYYCHKTWISHRTDLESFAALVKRMAQRLQVFGRELAETELPSNHLTASSLLNTHTSRKDIFKEDMAGALSQGRKILENIREPVRRDPDSSLNPDQLENLATVHRLLSQLNESSTAFDEFWIQHQNKLELCLKVCQFEHNFQQLRTELDRATETLNAFSAVGISPAQTEHLLQELTNHEKKVCEVLDRVRSLVAEGQGLIDSSQILDDSIAAKCSELEKASENLTQELKDKQTKLTQAMDLHKRLDMMCKWCDDGIYMLASQPLDKCQSQEGAESALSELECYLETANEKQKWEISTVWQEYDNILNNELREQVTRAFEKKASLQEMFDRRRVSLKKLAAKQTRPVQPVAPSPESLSSPAHRDHESICISEDSDSRGSCKQINSDQVDRSSRNASVSEEEETLAVLRRHVMNELLETERAYVEELMCVLQGYAAEMDNPSMAPLIPAALQNKKDVLFGNMQEIYNFHKRIFLRELETYTDYPELVGRCFLDWMGELQIYEKYCHNKPRSESLWRQCSDCAFFQECQKKLEHKLGLDSYLLKPVQRITKYQLLIKEMIKYSKGCEGSVELQAALSSILGILKAVNDSMHLIAITGYDGNLGDLGRLLMQGSFSVWAEHKRGHVKVMELARFKPMQRHLFLHEKALLFCKRREESGEGYEKAPSYSFKQELSMAAIGITEHAKGDSKKFEIWSSSRDEVYTIQAASEEVKTIWVTEIRKLLTGQLEACKERIFEEPKNEASQQRAPEQFTSESSSTNRLVRNERSSLKSDGVEKQKREEERGKELESIFESRTAERAKGSSFSFETKPKRQDVRSDPTPLGPHPNLGGVRWFSTSSLFQSRRRGWMKGSLSLDASVEHDGYFSAEEQANSDPEEEREDKLSEEEPQPVRIDEEIQCFEETEEPEE
ncbi:guanine nucleotide exchange factor DBS isoform X6 [Danio rerio]|uniref:Guanine nucleotide exchange factor DBS isoform X6 n=1 Tax=Danio rerio TaxID=7955 RepID=A0AC58GGM6_DANRE|nr:guanine nucleotide exchange factor DBS isoform X2 [Danio rerio]XP_021334646.1 guanine nucleotide exchange factor DBS isoform X2 [Danio rerio]|eukprot:XP_021327875.1 guanine nucleotide exchange factor DBS isoform X2 [Danio rerio]